MFQYLTLSWRQDLTTCKQEKLASKRSRVVTKPRNILACNGCNRAHSDHCGETDDSVHRDVDLENNIRATFLDVIMAQITMFCGCVRALPTLNTERWIEWLPLIYHFLRVAARSIPGICDQQQTCLLHMQSLDPDESSRLLATRGEELKTFTRNEWWRQQVSINDLIGY